MFAVALIEAWNTEKITSTHHTADATEGQETTYAVVEAAQGFFNMVTDFVSPGNTVPDDATDEAVQPFFTRQRSYGSTGRTVVKLPDPIKPSNAPREKGHVDLRASISKISFPKK